MTINQNIAYYRKLCGYTQEQLAERLGVTGQSVSKWENEISNPDISVLPDLAGGQTVRVVSARDMYDAFMERYPKTDIVIMAAAVADYRVANVADQKIKKSGEMDLHLVKNPDILRTMGEHKTHQFLVGFAAETQNVDEYATKKLKEKNLDLMIANNVAKEGAGFDSDTNIVTAFWSDAGGLNREEWPLLSKRETGKRIIEKIAQLLEK